MRVSLRSLLVGCIAFGLVLGVGSGAWGQVDPELLRDAESGNAEAQNLLGVMYDTGEGVAEDDAEAVKWYRKAAEQGHEDAQFILGVAYVTGEGVAENDAEAAKWFRKAAEQGHAEAQYTLG
jgi:hypothetical protein